ncbi:hypothetical protein AB9K17_24175, partial [Salmonella enterica subsp. enterica serovar Kentucky]
ILMKDAEKGANARVEVNLEDQTITSSDGDMIKFDIDPFRKHCLLNGLDDIGLTLEKVKELEVAIKKHNESVRSLNKVPPDILQNYHLSRLR